MNILGRIRHSRIWWLAPTSLSLLLLMAALSPLAVSFAAPNGSRLPAITVAAPQFGAIKFAARVTGDSQPVNPATEFPYGTRTVYAAFSYSEIRPDTAWTETWIFGDTVIAQRDHTGTEKRAGNGFVAYEAKGDALPDGVYELDLTVGGKTIQTATFKVNKWTKNPGKWIDVNLSQQRLYVMQGDVVVNTSLVSSGRAQTPTVVGDFRIYLKYEKQTMVGPDVAVSNSNRLRQDVQEAQRVRPEYIQPDVPYVNYFYQDFAIHGVYWHNNFGTPMSHGCVGAPVDFAKWLYYSDWGRLGTPVSVHK